MERLTIIDGCGNDELARCMNCGLEKAGSNLENCGMCEEGWQRALRRLAAYEDNGLTPEEIKNALDVNDIIPEINVTVDHIRDLLQAEQDGRLVVLPCKVGDTVYEPNKRGFISIYKVISIHLSTCSILVGWELIDGIYSNVNGFEASALGKTVFLTREEAEAVLAQKGGTHETDSV